MNKKKTVRSSVLQHILAQNGRSSRNSTKSKKMARTVSPNVSALKDVDVIEAMRQTSLVPAGEKCRVESERRRKRKLTMLTPIPRTVITRRTRICSTVVCT